MRALAVLSILALCIAPAMAQHQHGGTTQAHELHPGLGHYHHPITTKNPEAQTYFNQGLTLLYGFNHEEAARYFRRAAELDPEAAMPYWGLALAIGPNYNDTAVDEDRVRVTYDAVQKAIQRVPILGDARIAGGWAGLRPLTPDDHAIIGWTPGIEGFFAAVGFGGHGFQHSPATGRYVAEWLLDGKPSLDLSLFDPGRFARPAR